MIAGLLRKSTQPGYVEYVNALLVVEHCVRHQSRGRRRTPASASVSSTWRRPTPGCQLKEVVHGDQLEHDVVRARAELVETP